MRCGQPCLYGFKTVSRSDALSPLVTTELPCINYFFIEKFLLEMNVTCQIEHAFSESNRNTPKMLIYRNRKEFLIMIFKFQKKKNVLLIVCEKD